MNAAVLADMHSMTLNRITKDRERLADLEAQDFKEQFDFADDDQTRAQLCRRWLRIHAPQEMRAAWTQ